MGAKEPQGLQVAVRGGKASLRFWKHLFLSVRCHRGLFLWVLKCSRSQHSACACLRSRTWAVFIHPLARALKNIDG